MQNPLGIGNWPCRNSQGSADVAEGAASLSLSEGAGIPESLLLKIFEYLLWPISAHATHVQSRCSSSRNPKSADYKLQYSDGMSSACGTAEHMFSQQTTYVLLLGLHNLHVHIGTRPADMLDLIYILEQRF